MVPRHLSSYTQLLFSPIGGSSVRLIHVCTKRGGDWITTYLYVHYTFSLWLCELSLELEVSSLQLETLQLPLESSFRNFCVAASWCSALSLYRACTISCSASAYKHPSCLILLIVSAVMLYLHTSSKNIFFLPWIGKKYQIREWTWNNEWCEWGNQIKCIFKPHMSWPRGVYVCINGKRHYIFWIITITNIKSLNIMIEIEIKSQYTCIYRGRPDVLWEK